MRNWQWIVIFTLWTGIAQAQISEDSLEVLEFYPITDQKSLEEFQDIFNQVNNNSPAQGSQLLVRFRELADELDSVQIDFLYLKNKGQNLHLLNQHDSAMHYFNQALDLANSSGNKKYRAAVLLEIALVEMFYDRHAKAMELYQEVLSITDTIGNKRQYSNILNQMGHLYIELEQYDQALQKLQRALAIRREIGLEYLQDNIINSIGTVYYSLGQYDKVLEMDLELAAYHERNTNLRPLAFTYNNIGEDYMALKQVSKAIPYLKKSLQLKKQLGNENYLISTYLNISDAYNQLDQYKTGQKYLDTCARYIAKSTWKNKFNYYTQASKVAKQLGNHQSALQLYEQSIIYRDSIFNKDNAAKLSEIETRYETARKESENDFLKKEQELNHFTIARQRIWIGLIALVLVIIIVLLVMQHRSRQLLKAQKLQIQKQNEDLEAINHMKSSFFANISHELRTPLTLINGQLDALTKQLSKQPELLQRLGKAQNNSTQLAAMIDDLLDISRLELGSFRLQMAPVQLQQFLERKVASFESLAEAKNIPFTFVSEVDSPIYIQADLRQFEKVINNLVYNAFKFTPSGGQITVKLQSSGVDDVKILVEDTGPGIPQADIPFLFDRFFQSKAHRNQGSGLGLAIAKEIVQQHGGEISLQSELGHGTVFEIKLKQTPAPESEPELLESPAEEEIRSLIQVFAVKPIVLLVEDNEEMASYLTEILSASFLVERTANGAEALAWLKQQTPDLIISDVMMPVMDGFELMARLKASLDYRFIPTMLLTAVADKQSVLKGLTLGVDDYILKPFDRNEVLVRAVNLVKNLQHRLAVEKEIQEDPEEEAARPQVSAEDEQLIRRLESYIGENLKDPDLSVGQLAREVGLSERQLYRKVGQITGLKPALIIREVRLQHAMKLLVSGDIVKVSQLASEVGFNSAPNFAKLFFERFGKRPSDYIR